MPDEPVEPGRAARVAGGRTPMVCPVCEITMRFEAGAATHDLFAERFVCPRCGRTEYRSYGRGSV